ncbi:MAG: metallophosphoesterase [Urechidicola sp.]|nr:metallophosphoesterase [Urechidicola sp.]
MKTSNYKFLLLFTLVLTLINCKKESLTESKSFSIGIISDCQYCDCDIRLVGGADRYYRKAPDRLRKAIAELNKHELEFTIHLGDFIDKDFKSFDSINPIWDKLKSKSYHVLGNHDFSVADSLKNKVPNKMGLTNRYYSFELNNWKFIVLDGNNVSLYGAPTKEKLKEAEELLAEVTKDSLLYAKFYNGALGSEQLAWVKTELEDAKTRNLNVCFFNHFPASPMTKLNFWDKENFLALVKDYDNVKLYLNGHDHAGAYDKVNGVHYVTFKGIVDTENTNTFASIEFTKDSAFVKGYGREESRSLKLK